MSCETRNCRGGLMQELDRGLNRIVRDVFAPGGTVQRVSVAQRVPPVSVIEHGDRYVAEFDLPGVQAEQMSLEVEDGILTISGDRVRSEPAEGSSVIVDERLYGRFVRKLQLAKDVKTDGIDAEYISGILRITIPKMEQIHPKTIQIRTSVQS